MKRLPPMYLSQGLQSYQKPNFSSIVLESILIDINLLSHTNFTICTMSSNVCRLAYLLRYSIPPYDATNRVMSLDWQNYFERYYLPGYNVPLTNYYVTINRKDNIYLNIMGMSILLNYDTGYLYHFTGEKTRIYYKNYSYLYKMEPIHQSKRAICYIFFQDLMEWPGKPEYPEF